MRTRIKKHLTQLRGVVVEHYADVIKTLIWVAVIILLSLLATVNFVFLRKTVKKMYHSTKPFCLPAIVCYIKNITSEIKDLTDLHIQTKLQTIFYHEITINMKRNGSSARPFFEVRISINKRSYIIHTYTIFCIVMNNSLIHSEMQT